MEQPSLTPEGFPDNNPSFSTRAIHTGCEAEAWGSRALVPPITLATSYKQDEPDTMREFFYGRLGNPSRRAVEQALASLEEAGHAVTFGSGTAAIAAVIQLLQPGDHIIAAKHLYSGTWIYFTNIANRQGIDIEFIDCRDTANIRNGLKTNTRMVWVETPSNPTLDLVDLAELSTVVSQHNKQMDILNLEDAKTTASHASSVLNKELGKRVLVVVDNTFLTPFFQRPLSLGVDVVVHSCTKYLNGATDVIMGAVCTNSDVVHQKITFIQNSAGAIPSPFDCYLLHRSIRTLSVRMERHMKNGLAVGKFLESHPFVRKVNHPALPSHPQHELCLRQSFGHSGMVSFYLKEDDLEKSRVFLKALKTVALSTSLGGIESTIQLPLTMSHATVPPEQNMKAGITAGLMRMSVGLEDAPDILQDLDQALNKAFQNHGR